MCIRDSFSAGRRHRAAAHRRAGRAGQDHPSVQHDVGGLHVQADGGDRDCLLYTSDAADERSSVDLGGRRIIKKKTSVDLGGRRKNI